MITDEMRSAACEAFDRKYFDEAKDSGERLYIALIAALESALAAQAVAVKRDSEAVQLVREHVEKNSACERANFSIAGLRAVLAEIDALAFPPEPQDGWQIEVDEGTLILRRNASSITVCAKQATVNSANPGKTAVQVPLDADFIAVVDALTASKPGASK